MNNQKINRFEYIDVTKAVGILLVLLGHTKLIPENLYIIIYSFHMPLFFIISGILFNADKYDKTAFVPFIKTRFKAYIIPYFIYAGVNLVFEIIYLYFDESYIVGFPYLLRKSLGILLCNSTLRNMPNCTPIWFLMCLFVASLMFWFFINYCKKLMPIIVTLCVALSFVLSQFPDIFLPFKLETSLMAVFFIYIGYLLRRASLIDKIKNAKLSYLYIVLLIAAGITTALLNGNYVNMNRESYGNLFYFLISALTLSIALLIICDKWLFMKNRFSFWLSANTLFIIGYNYIIRDVSTDLLNIIPYVAKNGLHWTVSFVATTLLCFAGILITNKILNQTARKKDSR